jgi:hypothetical protein
MRPFAWIVAGIVVTCLSVDALAERPTEAKNAAAFVVVGEVKNVYSREKTFAKDGVLTSYVLELLVEKVEKGKGGPSENKVLFVRYFHVSKPPSKPIPGANGFKYDIKPEDRVRVWLMRNEDGGYSVIYNAEGIEIAKD